MKNFVYSGNSISFTATEALVSGQLYQLGAAIGVVASSLIPGQSGELFIVGVYRVKKEGGAINIGQRIFWDPKTKTLIGGDEVEAKVPEGAKVIGMAAGPAGAGPTEVLCRFNGVSL